MNMLYLADTNFTKWQITYAFYSSCQNICQESRGSVIRLTAWLKIDEIQISVQYIKIATPESSFCSIWTFFLALGEIYCQQNAIRSG